MTLHDRGADRVERYSSLINAAAPSPSLLLSPRSSPVSTSPPPPPLSHCRPCYPRPFCSASPGWTLLLSSCARRLGWLGGCVPPSAAVPFPPPRLRLFVCVAPPPRLPPFLALGSACFRPLSLWLANRIPFCSSVTMGLLLHPACWSVRLALVPAYLLHLCGLLSSLGAPARHV